jgi:ribonuclease HI
MWYFLGKVQKSVTSSKELDGVVVCDGSCLKNPGPGGWAYAVIKGGEVTYGSGGSAKTTNNIMELSAIIKAIEEVSPVEIYTDSTYAVNGISMWMYGWSRNGWRTAQKEPIKNLEMWQRIYEIYQSRKIPIYWIPGHSSPELAEPGKVRELITLQNKVDEIARTEASKMKNTR